MTVYASRMQFERVLGRSRFRPDRSVSAASLTMTA
jgi:hypothetical protein